LLFVSLSKEQFDEGTHLGAEDIAVDYYKAPRILKVRIKVSKIDPERGCQLSGTYLSPVIAYLAIRPQGLRAL